MDKVRPVHQALHIMIRCNDATGHLVLAFLIKQLTMYIISGIMQSFNKLLHFCQQRSDILHIWWLDTILAFELVNKAMGLVRFQKIFLFFVSQMTVLFWILYATNITQTFAATFSQEQSCRQSSTVQCQTLAVYQRYTSQTCDHTRERMFQVHHWKMNNLTWQLHASGPRKKNSTVLDN